MRALAVGDNHLGSGAHLARNPGERLAEQEQVWRSALELAREHDVDVVLHGGDLFDKRKPSPEEVMAAVRPLAEHAEEGGPPVLMALGNHERSGVSEVTMPAVLNELDIFQVASRPEVWNLVGNALTRDLSVPSGVAICVLPWVPVSWLVASQNGGQRDDVNMQAAELLLQSARGLRERVDGPAVMLTHFSISGSSLPTGLPVDQLREPILDIDGLDALGFDAIVAAHIHLGQVIAPGIRTPAFYVGSPMPLNFGEADDEHGVWILEPDPATGNERERALMVPRFVPIESRSLVKVAFEFGDLATEPPYEIAEALVMDAAVRATVSGSAEDARHFDVAAFRRAIYDAGAHHVAAVNVEVERVERARVEGLTEELSEIEALDVWMGAQGLNGAKADALRERTQAYVEAVQS